MRRINTKAPQGDTAQTSKAAGMVSAVRRYGPLAEELPADKACTNLTGRQGYRKGTNTAPNHWHRGCYGMRTGSCGAGGQHQVLWDGDVSSSRSLTLRLGESAQVCQDHFPQVGPGVRLDGRLDAHDGSRQVAGVQAAHRQVVGGRGVGRTRLQDRLELRRGAWICSRRLERTGGIPARSTEISGDLYRSPRRSEIPGYGECHTMPRRWFSASRVPSGMCVTWRARCSPLGMSSMQ